MEILKYQVNFIQLQIELAEVAKYIGYADAEIPSPIDEVILHALLEAEKLCHLQGGLVIQDNIMLANERKSIQIKDFEFRIKGRIFKELMGTEKLALFLCTAGSDISTLSKKLMKEKEMLDGYIYDVIGSLAVEKAMDIIQHQFAEKMAGEGYNITNRYSPGYCGWQTEEQFKLFQLLPDNFCNVRLTDSALMNPIKSISGIIGIGKNVHYNEYNCDLCDAVNCIYRKVS